MPAPESIRARASRDLYDAVVVGAGPNGLAAAITLAQRGRSVLLLEGAATIGGGCRTERDVLLPGFSHDRCSAVHPLGYGSPLFRSLGLEKWGLRWRQPPVPVAHPLDASVGPAVLQHRSLAATAEELDGADGRAWRNLFGPLLPDWDTLSEALLHPWKIARGPFGLARFGLSAIRSAQGLAESRFAGPRARALFAGIAAHAMIPLEESPSAAIALVLGIAGHAVGWPIPEGGSQSIADALAACFVSLGGEILTDARVTSEADLPSARAVFWDLSPRGLLRILAAQRLPGWYHRRLDSFRYGPAAYKIDYALDGPVPWRDPSVARAGTVHVGGTLEEIAAAEHTVIRENRVAERPYVLVAQQSLWDPTRAPDGKQTLWAYCHVPNGSREDVTGNIEAQIERFAPGFRDRILAKRVTTPSEFAAYSPNYIGGDINGGVFDWNQLILRPALTPVPWRIPVRRDSGQDARHYLCSASTLPGGGVHGMCGYWAALTAFAEGV